MKKEFLLDLCDAYQPQTIAAKSLKGGQYPVYGANGVIGYHTSYNHESPELVMGCRGSCGAMHITAPYSWINGNAMVIHPKEGVILSRKYLYYAILAEDLHDIITGTANPQITQTNLKKLRISICDDSEQARIVARIEEIFSQLDAGTETLLKTKAQLAVYRQAVLKEAFSSCVVKKPVRELSSLVTSGSRGWAAFYSDNGARFIRITDLTRTGIELKNNSIQYVSLPEKAEGKRSRLQSGDVLVSITADLGSIALIPENIGESYINQHIAMIRFNNPEHGKLMAWYLRSEWGQKDLLKNKRGGGKLGLGLDDIRDTPVPVVTNEEADRILSYIDSRLSICDSIEQTTNITLLQTEAMRQSILRDAFEGRL